MYSNRIVWKDAAVVIGISLAIAGLSQPFIAHVPVWFKLLSHYTSIIGYFFICCLSKKIDALHLAKVALLVFSTLTPIYLLMCWHLIGVKYSFTNLMISYIIDESISAILGVAIYAASRRCGTGYS